MSHEDIMERVMESGIVPGLDAARLKEVLVHPARCRWCDKRAGESGLCGLCEDMDKVDREAWEAEMAYRASDERLDDLDREGHYD